MNNNDTLRYPIGKFTLQLGYTAEEIQQNIQLISDFPSALETALKDSTPEQLDTPYREGGWTIRQVVHHLADSHMNAYIRIKWALTENNPQIKAYDENLWSNTPETKLDISISMELLKALHAKWVALLNGLTSAELRKTFIHPASGKEIPIDRQIAIYAWHGQHHLGHVNLVLK